MHLNPKVVHYSPKVHIVRKVNFTSVYIKGKKGEQLSSIHIYHANESSQYYTMISMQLKQNLEL